MQTSELLGAAREVLRLWDEPQDLSTEIYSPAYERLREAIAAENRRAGQKTELDEHYEEYVAIGGSHTMSRGAWERMWKLHLQYIASDRLSPYEGELRL